MVYLLAPYTLVGIWTKGWNGERYPCGECMLLVSG